MLKNMLRFGAPLAWLTGTTLLVLLAGVPTSRDVIYIWLGLGMAAFSATDLRSRLPRLVRDWAPLVAILFLYDFLRGFADGLLFHAHEMPQIRLEEAIFGKPIPTVWLQTAPLARRQPHALVGLRVVRRLHHALRRDAADRGAAVDVRARQVRALRDDGLRSGGDRVRDVRALPGRPAVDGVPERRDRPTTRTVGMVWRHIPIAHFSSLFENGQHYANNVAAMPSLHAAYALLVTLVLWRLVPIWARVLLAIYPLAMTFALVYSGEHYVSTASLGGSMHSSPTAPSRRSRSAARRVSGGRPSSSPRSPTDASRRFPKLGLDRG